MAQDNVSTFVRERLSRVSDNRPLYSRLMMALRAAVDEEVVARGGYLPSERELSEQVGVSRVTLRRAVNELVDEGLLVRRHGSKTMVAPRYQKSISSLTGFSEDIRARGQVPGCIWISRRIVPPSATEASALQVALDDRVVRLERLRTADGKPLAIERATLPRTILPSPDIVSDSLYETLQELGLRPVSGLQRLRASVMTKEDAHLLDSEIGAPLLIMERSCYLPDGTPAEFTQTRYNGDSYEFVTHLK